MSAPVTVRHDGAEWPLETFISAYHMVRVDPFALPTLDGDTRVLTVDGDGRVLPDCRAREVEFRDVVAFRLTDHVGEQEACYWCGTTTEDGAICDDCLHDAEYY